MMLLAWPKGTTCPAVEHLRWLRRAARVPRPMDPAERHRFAVERVTALLSLGAQDGWREADELPREAATTREARVVAGSHINIGDLALRWGRYGEARWRLDQAVDLATKYGYRGLCDMALASRAHLDWCTGAWAGLADGVAALARLHLANARISDALQVTSEPIAIVQRKQIWVWATDIAPARVAALAAAGRTSEAAQLVTTFTRGLHGRKAPAPKAGLTLCRAILAENAGDQTLAATRYAHRTRRHTARRPGRAAAARA
jgi:hypothetical protein